MPAVSVLRGKAAGGSSVTMADKIDMSLDDIIKMDRSQYRTTRGRGRGSHGFAGRGVERGFVAGGEAIRRGNLRRRVRQQPYARPSFAQLKELPDQWQRGMHEGVGLRRTLAGRLEGAGMGPSKLFISNLDYGVSDADMKDLFGLIGHVRQAAVHYDYFGGSLGTADVVFERRTDAIQAIKEYNGKRLDGRRMNVQLVTPAFTAPVMSTAARRCYAATGEGEGAAGTSQRPRGGFRGRGRGRGGLGGAEMSPSKLLLSNVDYGAFDADSKDVFALTGPVRRRAVPYDHFEDPQVTADVIFERRTDAVQAVKEYNCKRLDDCRMNIQMGTPAFTAPVLSTAARLRYAATGGRGGGGASTSQRPLGDFQGCGRGRSGRGGAMQHKVPSAEELDAELDAYFSKVE